MIDLTKKVLPSSVLVDGVYFKIKTDYCHWMRFAQLIKKQSLLTDFDYLYVSDVPNDRQNGIDALCVFYANENPLPRDTGGGSGTRSFDYEIDSDLIYSAFRQQYGIDLFKVNLHWHCFKALFSGLRETKFTDVIGFRLYEENNKKYETIQRDLKRSWAIETELNDDEKAALDEFETLLGD